MENKHEKIKKLILELKVKHNHMTLAESEAFVNDGEILEVSEDLFCHTYSTNSKTMRRDVYMEDEKGLKIIALLEKNASNKDAEWSEFKG
jgi:hypothetical protein